MVVQVHVGVDSGLDNALLHCHFAKGDYVCACVNGLRFSKADVKVLLFYKLVYGEWTK